MEIASVSKAGQLGNGLEYYLLLQITLQETQYNEGSVVRSGGTPIWTKGWAEVEKVHVEMTPFCRGVFLPINHGDQYGVGRRVTATGFWLQG